MAGEFVSDIKEIRRRAVRWRQGHGHRGSQADRKTVIRLLNESLPERERR